MRAVVLMALALSACSSVKSDVAEAAYLGQQLSCVDESPTKSAADECRAAVKAKWGRLDAGAEGSDQ